MRLGSFFSGGQIISIADETRNLPDRDEGGSAAAFRPNRRSVISTPDADGDLPIHVATAKENYMEVECLIQLMKREKNCLDCFNHLRQTPLHIAIIMKNTAIMRLLLENGASPRACDRFGNTSLHLATKVSNRDCVELLLNHIDCDGVINTLNYDGFSPLHLAALQQDSHVIKLLACRNANVDVTDGTSGRTPLFHAVENSFEDVVELLLGLGANVNLPSFNGITPLIVATDKGNKNVTSMLISRGAMISYKDEG